MATIVFFPEGAYGPTNNCVGIGDVLRQRGHRVVFIVEESFAGTLEAQGFEERLMRLTPPPKNIPHERLRCQAAIRRAEGEGFEPSTDLTARNGFRDRRIRPLCHLSVRRTA